MINATTLRPAMAQPTAVRHSGRSAVAGLAVVGGGLMVGGALLPWLTVYAGLDTFRGTDGLNGRVLALAGMSAVVLGTAYGWRPYTPVRWAIGLGGFGVSGFAAWVVAQLLGTYQQLGGDLFAVPSLGLGAFVALAGGLCVLGTLFVPHVDLRPGAPAAARQSCADADARAAMRTGVVAFLVAAAMIHLAVIGPHLSESAVSGVFFVGAGFAQIAAALLLTVRPSRSLLVTVVIGNALLILLWAVSRTAGLPVGPTPGVAEIVSVPDVLASLAEAVAVGLGVVLARRQTGPFLIRQWPARMWMGGAGVAAAGVAILGVIGVQAGGG